jgi:hypothetical protein
MTTHAVELVMPEDGTLILHNLPFKAGETVEVIVVEKQFSSSHREKSLLEFLGSLPNGPRSASTWNDIEYTIQAERDSWDR